MMWQQRDFHRLWLAWWLDGCPEPRTWYAMRRMAEHTDRFARLIARALTPAMMRVAVAVEAFGAVLRDYGYHFS